MVVGILVFTWVIWFHCAFNLCIILGMIGTPGQPKLLHLNLMAFGNSILNLSDLVTWLKLVYHSCDDNRYNRFAKTTASRLMVVGSRWIGAWIVISCFLDDITFIGFCTRWHLPFYCHCCSEIILRNTSSRWIGAWIVNSCFLDDITSIRLYFSSIGMLWC